MEQDLCAETDIRLPVKKTQTLMNPKRSFLFAQRGLTLDLLSPIDQVSISKL